MTSRDFEELFECLNRHEVRAIVVGAHAVAYHAKPRYTAIDGVRFDEAWDGRVAGHLGSSPVAYLGLSEFKRNKAASGRTQDLADLEILGDG